MAVDNGGTSVKLRCAISISDLYPELLATFHDGYIFIGNG
jgi:hypothetical protein